jgi:hypothetical protein
MKTYKEEFVYEFELSDLDLAPPFYEPGSDKPNDFQYMDRAACGESPPVNIRVVIAHLKDLLARGANYMYMQDHCDHRGYEFQGVEITEVT